MKNQISCFSTYPNADSSSLFFTLMWTHKSVSWYDLTTSKLAPDNNANAADPPNNVVETKDKGVVNVVKYIIREDDS